MLKLNLSEQEVSLVKKVCSLQLDSFDRILSGKMEVDMAEKLAQHKVTETELKDMISQVVSQYEDINASPDVLFTRHADLLRNFRQALDYNISSLNEYDELIPYMLNKLDLAIYVLNNRN